MRGRFHGHWYQLTIIGSVAEKNKYRAVQTAIHPPFFCHENNEIPEGFYDDIPEEYRFDKISLLDMKLNSVSPGNFAKKLCVRLWREIYEDDSVRLTYSYYGGGVKGKNSLDERRKSYLRKYVLLFFPGCAIDTIWKSTIVPRINESLRRPEKRKAVQEDQVGMWGWVFLVFTDKTIRTYSCWFGVPMLNCSINIPFVIYFNEFSLNIFEIK